jgi:hypothetical protein
MPPAGHYWDHYTLPVPYTPSLLHPLYLMDGLILNAGKLLVDKLTTVGRVPGDRVRPVDYQSQCPVYNYTDRNVKQKFMSV